MRIPVFSIHVLACHWSHLTCHLLIVPHIKGSPYFAAGSYVRGQNICNLVRRFPNRRARARPRRVGCAYWNRQRAGCESAFVADRGNFECGILPNIFTRAWLAGSPSSRSVGDSGAGRGRAAHRIDGAIWLGKNSRSRHSGSARSHSARAAAGFSRRWRSSSRFRPPFQSAPAARSARKARSS